MDYEDIRQRPKYAMVDYNLADVPSGTFVPMINLPAGALIIYGENVVREVSNAGTSHVIDVGTSGAANTYLNDDDFKALGRTSFSSLGTQRTSAQTTIGITATAVGTAATTGKGTLVVGYLLIGAADSIRDL